MDYHLVPRTSKRGIRHHYSSCTQQNGSHPAILLSDDSKDFNEDHDADLQRRSVGEVHTLMLPDDTKSTTPVIGRFAFRVRNPAIPTVDYEMGGIGINDTSQGLSVKLWTVRLSGDDVLLSAEDVADSVLFSRSGITSLGLAFDQSMRPLVTFVESGQGKFWWFDTTIPGMTFTDLPAGVSDPCCTLDERRIAHGGSSDVIIAYTRAGSLYYRQQRDRYTIERVLEPVVTGPLLVLGVNDQAAPRLQWRVKI